MIIDVFPYVVRPPATGQVVSDVEALLLANGRGRTYAHVCAVAAAIGRMAATYGLERPACETAAYCHDVAAIIRPGDMLRYARAQGLDIDPSEERHPFILHQRFSAWVAGDLFGVADERVLSAIAHHTTLKADPSDYDVALFLADKLAWDQAGVPPYDEIVRRALSRSLHHAALAHIQYVLDHGMILYPHRLLVEAHDWLVDYCGRG